MNTEEFINKFEKKLEDYAHIKEQEERIKNEKAKKERLLKKENIVNLLKKDYDNLDESDIVFLLKKMSEF